MPDKIRYKIHIHNSRQDTQNNIRYNNMLYTYRTRQDKIQDTTYDTK